MKRNEPWQICLLSSLKNVFIQSKTIKKLKSGDLLLEVDRKQDEVDRKQEVETLLKTTKIFDLKFKISLHHSLNSSKGVIRCPELSPCSDKEIIDNLKEQGVTGVRNLSVRKNGVIKSTNTYVLIFNTPIAEENQGCFSFCERRGLYSKSCKMLPMSGFLPPRKLLYEKANLWKLRWRKALQC